VTYDEQLAIRMAAERETKLDAAYLDLVAARERRDVLDLAVPLARLTGESKGTISYAYLVDQKMKVVEIEAGPGKTTHKLVGVDEVLPPGLKVLREQTLAEIIDHELEERARSRAYFSARSGQSRDLGTTNPELLARDVAAAKAQAEAIGKGIEAALPAALKGRLQKVKMDPALRREVEKALGSGDFETLNNIVARRRIVHGPTGEMIEVAEARRFDPDSWPMLDEAGLQALGPGAQQFNLGTLRERERSRLTAIARFGEKVVQGEGFPPSLRGD